MINNRLNRSVSRLKLGLFREVTDLSTNFINTDRVSDLSREVSFSSFIVCRFQNLKDEPGNEEEASQSLGVSRVGI